MSRVLRDWLAVAALLLLALTPLATGEPTFVYDGFPVSPPHLTLNGDASIQTTGDGSVLRLVPALVGQSGDCYTSDLFNVTDFSTKFQFRITGRPGVESTDGLTFVVQPGSPNAWGAGGGWLGYSPNHPALSVAVEFDTYYNSRALFGSDFDDPNGNHIGVDTNGNMISLATANVSPNLDDGNIWNVWIDYKDERLDIYASEQGTRPSIPTLSYQIDIPGTIGQNTAYVGLTAGTGSGYADHDILKWEFTAVPEPFSMAFIGAAFAAVVAHRLRRRTRPE
jgi:hypothetical protein